MKPDLLAAGAILLWAGLASLVLQLSSVPPLLLTGSGLLLGSVISLPLSRFRLSKAWRVPAATLLLGVFGLFGYHFALFFAFQNAPQAEANLVNYLWPVGIVLLTPILLKGFSLGPRHIVSVIVGFAGAAVAIFSGPTAQSDPESQSASLVGYIAALCAASIWAIYSVLTKTRPAFSTAAIGLFSLCSGVLAILGHVLLEPPYAWQASDLPWLIALGLGPLGAAFYLWDAALKLGDPRRIGILSFATPLLSTCGVLITQQRPLSLWLAIAASLIVLAGVIGMWSPKSQPESRSQNS